MYRVIRWRKEQTRTVWEISGALVSLMFRDLIGHEINSKVLLLKLKLGFMKRRPEYPTEKMRVIVLCILQPLEHCISI